MINEMDVLVGTLADFHCFKTVFAAVRLTKSAVTASLWVVIQILLSSRSVDCAGAA